MVLGAQVKSLPGSGPIFLIGRGQAGSLVSRVTWEITSDPWEGNKIYRKEDGKSWLDPHHISEKAKREPSVPAGSLHVRAHTHTHTCTHTHIHTHAYIDTYAHIHARTHMCHPWPCSSASSEDDAHLAQSLPASLPRSSVLCPPWPL